MFTKATFVRNILCLGSKKNRFFCSAGLLRSSHFQLEFHDSFVLFFSFFFSLVFKRGVPPAEQPFIVEDMPQMHRFVYDYYSHYVESLRAQREVWLTVKLINSVLGLIRLLSILKAVEFGQSQRILVTP